MIPYERAIALLKCLLGAYLATGAMLLATAALLYRFELRESVVDISVIAIYVVSSLLAGLLYSKGAPGRRFLWGLAAGAAYFLVIALVSWAVQPDFAPLSGSCATTLFICASSGMLGGMIG